MGARNQGGIGLSYRHASLWGSAAQFQTRFLESIPRPIAGLKFSTRYRSTGINTWENKNKIQQVLALFQPVLRTGDPGWKKLGSGMEKTRIGDQGWTYRIRNTDLNYARNEPLDSMWTRYLLKSLNSSHVGRNTMMLGTSVLEPGYDLHTTGYRYLSSNTKNTITGGEF